MVIELFIRCPRTPEQQAELGRRAAKLYAQYAARAVEKLPCSVDGKRALIESVADALLQKSGKRNEP